MSELFGCLTSQFRDQAAALLSVLLRFSESEIKVLLQNLQKQTDASDSPMSSQRENSTRPTRAEVEEQLFFFSTPVQSARDGISVSVHDFETFSQSLADETETPNQKLNGPARQKENSFGGNGSLVSCGKLVLTQSAKSNLDLVCENVYDPVPLLLEESTGVGKSATIDAAAKKMGNALVRFNMSSRVSVQDFLGKVELRDVMAKVLESFAAVTPAARVLPSLLWLASTASGSCRLASPPNWIRQCWWGRARL